MQQSEEFAQEMASAFNRKPTPDEIEYLKARTMQMVATTDNMVVTRYLQFLSELRMAIGFMTADATNQPTQAEQMHPMTSAFEEINKGRLENRYVYVTDLLIKQFEPGYDKTKW